MSGPALALHGVVKRYGRLTALDGLSLEVPRGVICGMVGPNGAGKTTTFGIAGGYVRANEGTVDVLGAGRFDPVKMRGRLTLLPQDCELNPHTSVAGLLAYYASLQGMGRRAAKKDAARVLDMVELADRAGARVKELSHGMRRRVAVAQAFLGDPELVLLDEPTNGLDPELVVRMRDLFRSQRTKRTLVVSSHNLAELEAISDHVVFLDAGKCVKAGALADVTGRATRIRVRLEAPIPLEGLAAVLPGVTLAWDGVELVVTTESGGIAELNARALPALVAAGARILEVRQGDTLESTYLASKRG